ncbi:hypothetical protein L218DRAFT_735754 [Marasmius fiardii PR-910]|nr:hypothetical protein L218DRAFT_735754 [Marasmius fiardii PR-910]
MTSFFEGAHNLKFSGSQSFTSANSITYNYHTLLESGHESSGLRNDESWLTLPGGKQRLRVVDICDVIVLKQISSETRTFHTLAKPPLSKPKNPSIARLERQRGSVKIRKEVQTAEIVQFGNRRFTVVSFKPEHQDDSEKIRKVLHPLCEAALSSRQAQLTQIFGVGRTTAPTLIYHDEFVNGWDIVDRYYEEAITYPVHLVIRGLQLLLQKIATF